MFIELLFVFNYRWMYLNAKVGVKIKKNIECHCSMQTVRYRLIHRPRYRLGKLIKQV